MTTPAPKTTPAGPHAAAIAAARRRAGLNCETVNCIGRRAAWLMLGTARWKTAQCCQKCREDIAASFAELFHETPIFIDLKTGAEL